MHFLHLLFRRDGGGEDRRGWRIPGGGGFQGEGGVPRLRESYRFKRKFNVMSI